MHGLSRPADLHDAGTGLDDRRYGAASRRAACRIRRWTTATDEAPHRHRCSCARPAPIDRTGRRSPRARSSSPIYGQCAPDRRCRFTRTKTAGRATETAFAQRRNRLVVTSAERTRRPLSFALRELPRRRTTLWQASTPRNGAQADQDRCRRASTPRATWSSSSKRPVHDGTKIPYFVVHPKALKLDGTNPTLLYAYGGFQVSMTPELFAGTIGKLWLEHGGVYVARQYPRRRRVRPGLARGRR